MGLRDLVVLDEGGVNVQPVGEPNQDEPRTSYRGLVDLHAHVINNDRNAHSMIG